MFSLGIRGFKRSSTLSIPAQWPASLSLWNFSDGDFYRPSVHFLTTLRKFFFTLSSSYTFYKRQFMHSHWKILFYFYLWYYSSFFIFIFISWRLIILQYCSGFYHTLTWISRGFTCIPHPDPPSHLPLYPIPLGLHSAPGLRTCLMHPTWAGVLFHQRWYTCFDAVLSKHPTLAFSHRVQKSVLYICVSFFCFAYRVIVGRF